MYLRVTPVPGVITASGQTRRPRNPAACALPALDQSPVTELLGVTVAVEPALSYALSPCSPPPRDDDPVFVMHRGGKIDVRPSVDVPDRAALAMAYTPGVARVCGAIADEPELAADYTWTGNTVAVVSDGT